MKCATPHRSARRVRIAPERLDRYLTRKLHELPGILQWFSGNIGFHHVHHLSPRIPNYNLQKCHESDPLFQQVKPITLGSSGKSLAFRLWDEQARKLVGFARMRQLRKEQQQAMTAGPEVPPHRK